MKKNRIISVLLAAVLVLTSLVFTSVSAAAADIPYYAEMSKGSGNTVYISVCGINEDEIDFLSTWGAESSLICVAFNYGEKNQLTLGYSPLGSFSMGIFSGQGLNIKSGAIKITDGVTKGVIFGLDTSDATVKKAVESLNDCTECKIQSVLITKEGNKNFYGNNELIDAKFFNGVSGYKTEGYKSPYTLGKMGQYAYTGKQIKPDLSIEKDGKKLVKGIDYTLTYKNNIKVGTATATATFTNDKNHVLSQQFSIIPSKPVLKAVRSGQKVKLTWSASKGCGKYQIQYSTDGGTTWSTRIPGRREPGVTKVLIRATNPNYETVQVEVELRILEVVTLRIVKQWENDTPQDRPGACNMVFHCDNRNFDRVFSLSAANNWQAEYTVPAGLNYRWVEPQIPGYDQVRITTEGGVTTVVNRRRDPEPRRRGQPRRPGFGGTTPRAPGGKGRAGHGRLLPAQHLL